MQSGAAAHRTQVHSGVSSEARMAIKTVVVSDREEDRMINPKTQHFMAKRMQARIHSFAVDHTPLLTAPERVLEVVIAAVKETLS